MTRECVLKVAGEPVAWLYKDDHLSGDTLSFMRLTHYYKTPSGKYITGAPLYTEAQLLAMYAAGAEDMRERAIESIKDSDDQLMDDFHVERIRALPVTTNTEGEPV